ncbi:MAG: electron transport complex subunit E [Clostridia bacterium]|nr:electron transport complex subunit E [Clostridia bacterium]
MAEKLTLKQEFTKGILKENPTLRLVLGTCPTLAVTTSVTNAIGMGLSAAIVLVCSNVVISALRKVISPKVRIPSYIVVIASFVTLVQMLVKAFLPALDDSLGVYLPLIVVNCIILGRAEAFAGKNPVLRSALDGLGMGIGFTLCLCAMGTIREILGNGTFLAGIADLLKVFGDNVFGGFNGFDLASHYPGGVVPMTVFILPAGGFFVFGMLIAAVNGIVERKGGKKAREPDCAACPMAGSCAEAGKSGAPKGEDCAVKNGAKAAAAEQAGTDGAPVPAPGTREGGEVA